MRSPRPKYISRFSHSIDIDAFCPQVGPRQINLLHELGMRSWDIIECEDTEAEAEE